MYQYGMPRRRRREGGGVNAKNPTGTRMWAGTVETCPALRYLTGFVAVDPAILIACRKRRILIVSSMETARARDARKGNEVYCPADLKATGSRRRMSATDSAAAVLRKLRVRRVTVEPQFPIGLGRALERKGIGVVVARGTMTPERQVKAPGEVSNIRESQRAAVLAMRAAIDMIAGSRADAKGVLRIAGAVLTCESVKERIEQVLLGERCSATQTIVACGEQAVNPHEAGHGAIRAHEAIVVDIFPRHREHGYWGDLTRTVVKGKASRKLRSIYEAVRRAQEAGLRKIRAGVSGSAVHRAVDVELARRGFETGMQDGKRYGFIHSTGHGVGLEVHEAPSLAPGGRRLRAGNVVTVEPGLYYPGIGAVRIEDTVVVTSAGCCLLARCEHRFEL